MRSYFERLEKILKSVYGNYQGNVVTVWCFIAIVFIFLNFASSVFYFVKTTLSGNYVPLILAFGFAVSFSTFYLTLRYQEAKEEVEKEFGGKKSVDEEGDYIEKEYES